MIERWWTIIISKFIYFSIKIRQNISIRIREIHSLSNTQKRDKSKTGKESKSKKKERNIIRKMYRNEYNEDNQNVDELEELKWLDVDVDEYVYELNRLKKVQEEQLEDDLERGDIGDHRQRMGRESSQSSQIRRASSSSFR